MLSTGPADEDQILPDVQSVGGDLGLELGDSDTAVQSNNILPVTGTLLSKHRALVLDNAYRPINTVNWFKALMMEEAGKVDVLVHYDEYALSSYREHQLPAVLRVRLFVDIHEIARVSLTRRNLMLRDKYTCQYCGSHRELTVDHVVPLSKGGGNSWSNLVTACAGCNQRKGSNTLRQLGWKLRQEPREPSPYEVGQLVGVSPTDIVSPPKEWRDYIEPFLLKVKQLQMPPNTTVRMS